MCNTLITQGGKMLRVYSTTLLTCIHNCVHRLLGHVCILECIQQNVFEARILCFYWSHCIWKVLSSAVSASNLSRQSILICSILARFPSSIGLPLVTSLMCQSLLWPMVTCCNLVCFSSWLLCASLSCREALTCCSLACLSSRVITMYINVNEYINLPCQL